MNMQSPTQKNTTRLPSGFSSGTLKTLLVISLLVLVVMNWSLFIGIFVNLLLWIYDVVGGNFGIAIILFTLLIRVVTWPLNAQQMKGAQAMQEMQNDKSWQAIQKKYAKDREKLAQEQMRYYNEHGISPFASCLPLLIQMPLLFALFQSINRALATTPDSLLQLARSVYPFLSVENIIPLNSRFLWMDLSRPESLPILGFALPTLAIVVALSTYVQSKLMAPPSTNPNDQAAAMSSSMAFTMPLMLGWWMLSAPSGVAVYLLTTNVLSVVQYALQGKANWRALVPGASQPAQPKK